MRVFLAFSVVLIISAAIQYWYIVIAVVALWLFIVALRALLDYRKQCRWQLQCRRSDTVSRADEQHALWMAGDPRGIYGGTLEYARQADELAQPVLKEEPS